MVFLSRKAQLQRFSWQVLEDLAFCSVRWPRLSELAAQVLIEQQAAAPGRASQGSLFLSDSFLSCSPGCGLPQSQGL